MKTIRLECDRAISIELGIQGEELYRIEKQINHLEGVGGLSFIEAGRLWNEIKTNKLWRLHGNHIHSFREYIEKEMGRKYTGVMNRIKIFKRLKTEGFEIEGIDYSKLEKIANLTKSMPRESIIEILKVAVDKPYRAFLDHIRNQQGKITTDNCDHENKELFSRCRDCGKWIK